MQRQSNSTRVRRHGIEKVSYLCCFHIKTFTYFIAVTELSICFIDLISAIAVYVYSSYGYRGYVYHSTILGELVGGILGFVIGLTIVLLMIYGLRKEQHSFLIPHLIAQVKSYHCLHNFLSVIVNFLSLSD